MVGLEVFRGLWTYQLYTNLTTFMHMFCAVSWCLSKAQKESHAPRRPRKWRTVNWSHWFIYLVPPKIARMGITKWQQIYSSGKEVHSLDLSIPHFVSPQARIRHKTSHSTKLSSQPTWAMHKHFWKLQSRSSTQSLGLKQLGLGKHPGWT